MMLHTGLSVCVPVPDHVGAGGDEAISMGRYPGLALLRRGCGRLLLAQPGPGLRLAACGSRAAAPWRHSDDT